MILTKKYLSFPSQKVTSLFSENPKALQQLTTEALFSAAWGATSHSCSQKASSLQLFSEAFTLCLSLRWWNLSIRRDEHQDRGPQSCWHQLLVSWKTAFPQTWAGWWGRWCSGSKQPERWERLGCAPAPVCGLGIGSSSSSSLSVLQKCYFSVF